MIRTKEDIEYHSDRGPIRPAVNVKVYGNLHSVELPLHFGFVASRLSEEFQPIYSEPEFTHEWIEENLTDEELDAFFWLACRDGWEELDYIAEDIWGKRAKVYSQGRSGGWAVVHGINNDVDTWDAVDLARWRSFSKQAKSVAEGIPRTIVENIYLNYFLPT